MNKLWNILVLFLFMAASVCQAEMIPIAADNTQAEDVARTENTSHQLLVMLHMPLPHFRPDSSYSGRYDDSGHKARRRIAEAIAALHKLKLISNWPMPTLGVDCYLMESTEPVENVKTALTLDKRVEWVQEMSVYHTLAANDPLYSLQPSAKFWHLSEIHQVTTGRNIRIAVIDSGVDDNHPDLTGQVNLKENFIDNNPYVSEAHGTAVAGIIGAKAGNGVGIEGVASNAQLMALRACWELSVLDTQCNSFTLGKALNFAILHKAQVINLSLTGPTDKLLQLLLDAALAQGITVVGAFDTRRKDGGFPASHPGVLAISDEDVKQMRMGAMLAPGRDIPTTVPGGKWGLVNGASFACAHVSGLVALLLELNPAQTSEKIKQKLVVTPPVVGRTEGTIDACASVAQSVNSCVCSCNGSNAAKVIH